MAVVTIENITTDWCLEEASEVHEYREKDDGTREYRSVVTIVVSRGMSQMTSWTANGLIADETTEVEYLNDSAVSASGGPGNIYAAGTLTAFVGIDNGATARFDNLTKISDITTPAGPKGSEQMQQVQEWVTVSDWEDYPYDKL